MREIKAGLCHLLQKNDKMWTQGERWNTLIRSSIADIQPLTSIHLKQGAISWANRHEWKLIVRGKKARIHTGNSVGLNKIDSKLIDHCSDKWSRSGKCVLLFMRARWGVSARACACYCVTQELAQLAQISLNKWTTHLALFFFCLSFSVCYDAVEVSGGGHNISDVTPWLWLLLKSSKVHCCGRVTACASCLFVLT